MTQKIVVWDPAGEFWDGALVDEQRGKQLEVRGAVLLPVVMRLLGIGGIGGFQKRSWGSGWPLASPAPATYCPMTIYGARELRALYWAARLVPASPEGPHEYAGQLRLSADGSQPHSMPTGYSPTVGAVASNLSQLGEPDEHGGWTLRGNGAMSPTSDGYYGFTLYGYGPGLRVAWAAVSQAEV